VLRCEQFPARIVKGAWQPAYNQWRIVNDPSQPIGPLDVALWLAAAVLGFVVIKKLKPWIWLSALGRFIASQRELPRYFAFSAANLIVRSVIAAIWGVVALFIIWGIIQAGISNGDFAAIQAHINASLTTLHNQISIWLSVLPAGLLENVFIGSVIASLIACYLRQPLLEMTPEQVCHSSII
jgi:hypothetical protein